MVRHVTINLFNLSIKIVSKLTCLCSACDRQMISQKFIQQLIHNIIGGSGVTIGGHGTLQKYRGTGTRYFAKISTAVPVLSN